MVGRRIVEERGIERENKRRLERNKGKNMKSIRKGYERKVEDEGSKWGIEVGRRAIWGRRKI